MCGTAFRVQSSQLAAHSGTVRCGKCSAVFNGVAALVEEDEERLALEPSPQLGLFDPSRRAAAEQAAGVDAPLPDFLATPDRPPRRMLWLGAAALAALALAGQAAYRFRAELAVASPALRAPLQALCAPLGCDVPLLRRPELMSIESSEVQADPRRPGLISFNAVIRNNAPFVQGYPTLELTLNSETNQPLMRRLLRPVDYLDPATRPRVASQGIGAGGEASVRLLLDPSGTAATGYRLCLVYPGYAERCQ